jgi:hypothetical protein
MNFLTLFPVWSSSIYLKIFAGEYEFTVVGFSRAALPLQRGYYACYLSSS